MDVTTKRVVEMYSQYPWPLVDRRYDIFKYTEYPFIRKFGNIGSILDAGCGTGNVANGIAELLPETRVVGIDVVEDSLRIARESAANLHLRNVEFRNSDLLRHDPELGTFDFVHCWGVIHHLSDPKQGLENLHKYLNLGRYAYIWVYMLLGRRWILDIREILTLLGTTDKSYEERIEWTKKILSAYDPEKLPEGIKRHHYQNKPIVSRLLRTLESSIHLLSDSGWKALMGKAMKKSLGKADSFKTLFSSEPKTIDAEHEDRVDRITLADKFLHPHSVYFRMSEIVNLVTEIGFSDMRISEGMSASLQQFFGDDFPDIKQVVASLPIEKQYQFMELVEKPSGLGFFVCKPG